jgi:hypothetical protein
VLELRERDRLESLFLEVLEDQSKRELLLYLLCYIQLVKKEGNFSIGLDRFLGCAYRSFRASRSQWKDILVELNLLKITDIYGNVYVGKDIYKLQEDNLLFVSLYEQYLEDFYGFSNKVVKYWSIAHKLSYGKLWNPQDAIHLGVYIFNEELYEEYMHYSELQKERFRKEAVFFEVLEKAVKGTTVQDCVKCWWEALELAKKLPDVYYGVDVEKLRKSLENNWRRCQKGKKVEKVKVEFVRQTKGKGFWRYLKDTITRLYRRLVHKGPWNITLKEERLRERPRLNV